MYRTGIIYPSKARNWLAGRPPSPTLAFELLRARVKHKPLRVCVTDGCDDKWPVLRVLGGLLLCEGIDLTVNKSFGLWEQFTIDNHVEKYCRNFGHAIAHQVRAAKR